MPSLVTFGSYLALGVKGANPSRLQRRLPPGHDTRLEVQDAVIAGESAERARAH